MPPPSVLPSSTQPGESASRSVFAPLDPDWAWAPYRPSEPQPWNLARVAHLYRRAGFSAPWSQLQWALEAGPQAALEQVLAGGPETSSFYDQVTRMAGSLGNMADPNDLAPWWLYVMVHTPHPLLEKMTLLLHGHFATSAAKVTDGRMMYQQNVLLRRHALGKFGPLLGEMAKDPAMLVWLDSTTNRKGRPNENFAREVMELFSLGLGNYTESDIKEAARAFTGWEVRQGRFYLNRRQHDEGLKTVLGQRGPLNGDDVIGILLRQPAAGRFLAGKVFRYLVSEADAPPPSLLEPLADGLRQRDYDLAWLVRTVLESNLFYSPAAMGQKIKAPVEFAVGLIRALEGTTNTYALAGALKDLGQGVFYPPNVKGWDGGAEWINSATLVARANLVWALVSGSEGRYTGKIALERLSALQGIDSPAETVRRLLDVLLAAPVPEAVIVQLTSLASDDAQGDRRGRLARLVHAICTLPEFQVA